MTYSDTLTYGSFAFPVGQRTSQRFESRRRQATAIVMLGVLGAEFGAELQPSRRKAGEDADKTNALEGFGISKHAYSMHTSKYYFGIFIIYCILYYNISMLFPLISQYALKFRLRYCTFVELMSTNKYLIIFFRQGTDVPSASSRHGSTSVTHAHSPRGRRPAGARIHRLGTIPR